MKALLATTLKSYPSILLLAMLLQLILQPTSSTYARTYVVHHNNLALKSEKVSLNNTLISRLAPADERIRNVILLNKIASLDDYILWLKANIRYKKDKKLDIWSHPEETLERKYGDCEDLAFLNKRFLAILNYQPKVFVAVRPLRSHAVCVFKEGGNFSLIDNTSLTRTHLRSEKELTGYLLARYNCSSLKEIVLNTKTPEK